MGLAIRGTRNVFENVYTVDVEDSRITERKREIINEAMAVLEATLKLPADSLHPRDLSAEFWLQWEDTKLIDLIVEAGKSGVLDAPRAGGWDLKRHVKVNRDPDAIKRYVPGYTPLGVNPDRVAQTREDVKVEEEMKPTRKEKVVLATVGADAHVVGINVIREAFVRAGYDVVYLRGMNLPRLSLKSRRKSSDGRRREQPPRPRHYALPACC